MLWCGKIKYRIDASTGKKNFAMIQAERWTRWPWAWSRRMEWRQGRHFDHGPGLSLMSEFLGVILLEIPAVLFDVQRSGPRPVCQRGPSNQTSSLLHMLPMVTQTHSPFPVRRMNASDMTLTAFDLAEFFQDSSDCTYRSWSWHERSSDRRLHASRNYQYNRGKMYDHQRSDDAKVWGRYLDIDGDGIPYRTIPVTNSTHPKALFSPRGSSRHDPMAAYTEDGDVYIDGMRRLEKNGGDHSAVVSWDRKLAVLIHRTMKQSFISWHIELCGRWPWIFGKNQGIALNALRIKSFPFTEEIIRTHP